MAFLTALFNKNDGTFERHARTRGLKKSASRNLATVANEMFPDRPECILESRECFERAARRAVLGDGANLELSFRLADALANAVETLGLTRSSDVPDPFRRVWVQTEGTDRRQGVVISCENEEIAVFCPPVRSDDLDGKSFVTLSYRGFTSSVAYKLRLNDAVLLPHGLMLHFTRAEGRGAIGRTAPRFEVELDARIRTKPGFGQPPTEWVACKVFDISSGGMRISCPAEFDEGDVLLLETTITGEAFDVEASQRWRRMVDGEQGYGIMFSNVDQAHATQLENYLTTLAESK